MTDAKAEFAEFVRLLGPSVYRLALAITGSPDMADDLFQQTFLLMLEKKPSFSCAAQARVWLLKSVRKLAASSFRRGESARTYPLESAGERGAPDSLDFELLDLLNTLPEKYRQATLLFYVEDMSISDISKALCITVPAVKTRLMRARKMLRDVYGKENLL